MDSSGNESSKDRTETSEKGVVNRFNKQTMDANYIAFVEKPDYDDDEIDEDLEQLMKMPGAAAFTS